jgi:uncharacterized membrane protein YjjP (DUF1212 family)
MYGPAPTSRSTRPLPDAAVTEPAAPDAEQVEQVAHLALLVGRLLLANGSDTERVEASVERFAAAFGCEAHLMASYETLLLTVVAGVHLLTKIGHRVPAMNVGLGAIEAINRLVEDAEGGRLGLAEAAIALAAVEHRPREYNRWLVVVALGLTAASLSRLFGGDWACFGVAWVAGAVGTWLRQELGRRQINPVAIPFAAACLSGIIGGIAVRFGLSGTPSLCLIAPGMIIVPGVPLINGVQDMIRNHMTLGISRLGFAGLVTIAIAFGLYVATVVTGASIPVQEPAIAIPVPEDAVFSALAAIGFAMLFNVPARVAWACVVCGVASHTTRTLCEHMGMEVVAGTLVGALVVGFLAHGFARSFRAPSVAFAFPGTVAMIPGAYAFRAVLGALQIQHGTAAPALVQETLVLSLQVVLMVGAIAVGVVAPAILLEPTISASRRR